MLIRQGRHDVIHNNLPAHPPSFLSKKIYCQNMCLSQVYVWSKKNSRFTSTVREKPKISSSGQDTISRVLDNF